MFHRYLFSVLACGVLILSTGIIASAQSGQLRGHVIMKNPDGTTVRVADAVVDVYRVDVAAKYEAKTNKKGEFVWAGLPFIGTYIIAVSHPGASPNYIRDVKVGRDIDYEIELFPSGDGKRYTLAEIKAHMASGSSSSSGDAKPSPADAAKRAELMKKNAEMLEANKRAETSNAMVERAFKAGNEAHRTKNYDAAITQYSEGLAADPEHPGVPALLTNKAVSLNARGVERFNAALKASDDAAKAAGFEAAKKDWREASELSSKAVAMLKARPVPTDAAEANTFKTNSYFALLARADAMRLFVPKVDQSKVDEGVTAYQEYIAAETDAVKKTKAHSDLAGMLFDANAFDRALSEYKKILETNPDDLNALLRAGQSLFNIGAVKDDKATYQEAANYLAQYIAKAPDTDPLKADAKGILEALNQANVKPEKTAAPARRTRRP